MFIADLFIEVPNCKQPKCMSVEEWLHKMWYLHNGILISKRMEQTAATNMICYRSVPDITSKSSQEQEREPYNTFTGNPQMGKTDSQ